MSFRFVLMVLVAGATAVKLVSLTRRGRVTMSSYSIPDQPKRFALAKAEKNTRMLDIDAVYKPEFVRGKTVLVTGGNRGLGLAIVQELVKQGAHVIVTSRSPAKIEGVAQVIDGIDVVANDCGQKIANALKSKPVDILINNAGYFYEPVEKIDSLNFEEQLKMIDICALGPLRVTAGLYNAGLLKSGSKVAMITSQGGSITWRTTQNPTGHDYGHHMSKASANMMGVLLSQELKGKGICVTMLHPGFNKTDMTKKYEAIWEIEGAVDSSVGAKRVVHEIGLMEVAKSGIFINCEDGLEIPW
jgi:NAD(P)-dependent dehydrogenase (short-subunit alcohol dehydrogenase family)